MAIASSIIAAGVGAAGGLASKAIGGGGPKVDPKTTDFNAIAANLRPMMDRNQQLSAELRGYNPETQQDYLRSQEFRGQQMGLANQLQQTSQGQGPFIADESLRQQREANLAQALALQSSARPGQNAGLLARNTLQNVSSVNQQASRDAALQRLMEVQQARQLLGSVAGQGRQQDLGTFQEVGTQRRGNAALAQGYEQMNLQALQAQAAANAGIQGSSVMAQQSQQDQANKIIGGIATPLSGAIATELNKPKQQEESVGGGAAQGVLAGMSDKEKKKDISKGSEDSKGFLEAITDLMSNREAAKEVSIDKDKAGKAEEGFKKAMGFSDERLKKDMKVSPEEAMQMMEKLKEFTFKYKEPEKYGKGERLGVMAQDLEKSKAGKEMVLDTPDGKMVDYAKGYGAVLASLANLNDRIKKVEG